MTAPHTDRPFDAVAGATALSATRFHFMWTCVSADSPSSAPLLSPYFPFFHCRGSDFVTGFEEPDPALNPGCIGANCFRDNLEKVFSPSNWVRGVSQYGPIGFGSINPSFGDF